MIKTKLKQPLIKWTGSKRPIANKIISYFPKEIETYYEPFIGGGSVFFELLRSDIEVENFVISDINKPLIGIYHLVKNNPSRLIEEYEKNWNIIQKKPEHFYDVRALYNKTQDPSLLYFLTRTCYNGTIRYNSSGEFNTSHHFGRTGMSPDKIEKIIKEYSQLMSNRNIFFKNKSFEKVIPEKEKDVIYLDPPYTGTSSLYFGNISMGQFIKYISSLKCSWFLNINSINKTDNEEKIDVEYDEKILLKSGKSSFSKLKNLSVSVEEYFYYKKVQ